jgi:hypothetical protein
VPLDIIRSDAAVHSPGNLDSSSDLDTVSRFDSPSPRGPSTRPGDPPGRGDASEDWGSRAVPLSSSETAPPPESEEVEPEARGGRGGEDERQLVGGAPPPVAAADTSPSAGSGRTPTRRCIT